MQYLTTEQLIQKMREIAVIPVAVFDDAADALPAAKALKEGGLPAIEITFRTAAAADAIALIKKELPDMLIGAGTVLTPEQVKKAAEVGADFLVSPGLNKRTLNAAKELGIPMIPGVCTPTEAEAAGGLPMIKAMSAPYGMLTFMPTGGITLENLGKYLAFRKIAACGGSFMLTKELLKNKDYAQIANLSRQAAEIAGNARKGA